MRATRFVGALAGVALVATVGAVALPAIGVDSRANGVAAVPTPPAYRIGYTTAGDFALVSVQPDGSGATGDLFRAEQPSAVGEALAWVGYSNAAAAREFDGEIFHRPAPGVAGSRLTDDDAVDREPALSPDGRRIAFSSNRSGSFDIWVINVDGTGLRRVTADPGPETWPAWSPDGARLAYSGSADDLDGDIYVVAASGAGASSRLGAAPGPDTQPAWSPDGALIAFTSQRFRAAGDVMLVPVAGGGPVRRAVPDPWDSREPAWSPDGTGLAFVTRRLDPAGDVYRISGSTVAPVLAEPARSETHPTWHPGGLLLVVMDAGDRPTEIFDADARGLNRRNLSHHAPFDDSAPAFSPDGTRLAYSSRESLTSARIAIADPDGRNARLLVPPGTLDEDTDTDPAWSPDGTMLAFTRDRGGLSEILVARVADGALLGSLPVPPHLEPGFDVEPAWSPDGRRIAFSRTVSVKRPPTIDIPDEDRPATPGSTVEVPVTVRVPDVPVHPDVVFLVDGTESMADSLAAIDDTMFTIGDEIEDRDPSARFGLAVYGDLSGAVSFDVLRPLSDLPGVLINQLDGDLGLEEGEDNNEDWISALHKVVTGAPGEASNARIAFSPERNPVIILIGDSASHDPSGGSTLAGVVEELLAAQAQVLAIDVLTSTGFGLNRDRCECSPLNQGNTVTAATGGLLRTSDDTVAALTAALREGVAQLPVTVTPEVESCDAGLTASVEPGSRTVAAGGSAAFTARVQVSSSGTCSIVYLISDGSLVRQRIRVRVPAPGAPSILVGNTSVNTTDPTGAVVSFDVTRGPGVVAVSCTPESGSRFPVGRTLVTCTAVGANGVTATDTGWVTVIDTTLFDAFTPPTRIWVATVDILPSGGVDFTDQVDISGIAAAACQSGRLDQQPAWSPRGDRIVFVRGFDNSRLCLAAPDGTGARVPFPILTDEDQRYREPAFSPDGAIIAFGIVDIDSGGAEIWSGPAGGGATTPLITGGGYDNEPAFAVQPVADVRLTVSTTPVPGFVGGDALVVTYTIHNGTSRSFVGAALQTGLPQGLPVLGRAPLCATAARCVLGPVPAGGQVDVAFRLRPDRAVDTRVTGRVTAFLVDGRAATADAAGPLRVLQPVLTIDPVLGPPGLVPQAHGENFPPGALVSLTWTVGVTARPGTVRVRPDGTFDAPALVFRRDILGPRRLVATGPGFGEVSADFLVVPRALDPPEFTDRR